MTHGYEFFEYDYVDLEDYYLDLDYFMQEYEDRDISELWGEIEDIYKDIEEDTEEYDIYEQNEEEQMF